MIVTSTAAAQALQILARVASSTAQGEERVGTAASVQPPRPQGNPFGRASPDAAAAILELKTNLSVSVEHPNAEKTDGLEDTSPFNGGQDELSSSDLPLSFSSI